MPEANRISELTEVDLLRKVAAGDEAAVDSMLQRHGDAVMRFVYRRLGTSLEDAEEITQDVFLTAVSLASTYDGSCAVLTWLCGIAKLRIIDFLRHRGRDKRVPPNRMLPLDEVTIQILADYDPAVSPVETALDRIDSRSLVDAMLNALSDEEREAILLRYVEGFSTREIAAHLGRSQKAVESFVDRARKKAVAAVTEWLQ